MSFPLPQRIIVFFLGLGLAWALAQSPAEANEVDWAKLDDYLSSEITRARVPGVVVLAVDREQVIFSGVYGTQASRDPLRLDQPLLIGSLSKSFTALAVMQLVEGGQLDLEGMVEQYLPGVPGGERITIHQLLHHTSGYGAFQDRHHLTVTETSERHSYAGVNYVLLGEIIAAVSGQSYGDYVKEQIFAPLGLTNAYTTLEEARQGGLAIGHRNYFGFPVPEDVGQPAGKDFTSPSEGNLLASASDMGRYLQAFLNRGESIASPASIDQILNDRVPESDTVAYGLGWYFSSRFSEPLWHHGGAAENYQASMILLPTSGRGIVILSNSNDLLVGNKLMKTIFASTMKILTGEPPADQDGADYLSQHLVFNAIYLAIFLGAALPAVGLKRWVKTVQQRKTWRVVFWDLLAHLAYPLGLAAIPYVLGYPYFLMRGYIPDLYLVWMTAIGIALITGVIKAGWWLRHRRHVRPSGPA